MCAHACILFRDVKPVIIKFGEDCLPTAFLLITVNIGSKIKILRIYKKIDVVEEDYGFRRLWHCGEG